MLVGSAVGMTPPPLFTHFLAGLDADRQYHEQRQRPEQGIDGEDRGQLHRDQSSLTTDTSTIGFLPVHAVAVRRAASRRASRSLASPALASDSAAAFTFMRTSSKNDSRSTAENTSELQSL